MDCFIVWVSCVAHLESVLMNIAKAIQNIIFRGKLATHLFGIHILCEKRAAQPQLFVQAFGIRTQQHFHAM